MGKYYECLLFALASISFPFFRFLLISFVNYGLQRNLNDTTTYMIHPTSFFQKNTLRTFVPFVGSWDTPRNLGGNPTS